MLQFRALVGFALSLGLIAPAGAATKILFVGTSFTSGANPASTEGASVVGYKPYTVTNAGGSQAIGGLPALFKEFTVQAGLDYSVSLEIACCTLKDHYNNKFRVINRPWDVVVLQENSILDPENPGDPANLITYAGLMAGVADAQNPDVEVYLTATWSRADLTYRKPSPWRGQPIDAMARDIQAGNEQAAAASPNITDVIEVGAAWNDAMLSGLADPNPYDGIAAGQLNLWGSDNYHATVYGSYLSALMQFGAITGIDPRTLGSNETAAAYFGFTPDQTEGMQDVAYERLLAGGFMPLPEPSAWIMMMCGFGAIGGALRHQRRAVPV